jgi:hypothetical protein
MIRAQTRTSNDSIAFIEKTYRKKDSKYADFSIRWQKEILRRLSEEWTRSECREPPPTPVRKVWVSPYPETSIKARGELKKCEKIRAEIHATNDAIAFIEKTYRKKDPAYADFSVQWQQETLRRLSEEWNRSECREPSPTPEKRGSRVNPVRKDGALTPPSGPRPLWGANSIYYIIPAINGGTFLRGKEIREMGKTHVFPKDQDGG